VKLFRENIELVRNPITEEEGLDNLKTLANSIRLFKQTNDMVIGETKQTPIVDTVVIDDDDHKKKPKDKPKSRRVQRDDGAGLPTIDELLDNLFL